MNEKQNCYNCKFRRNLPGNAHSRCKHPEVEAESLLSPGLQAVLSMARQPLPVASQPCFNKLKIQYDEYGWRRGWFNWPANFDPCWLTNCNGFKSKDEECLASPECGCEDCEKEKVKMD